MTLSGRFFAGHNANADSTAATSTARRPAPAAWRWGLALAAIVLLAGCAQRTGTPTPHPELLSAETVGCFRELRAIPAAAPPPLPKAAAAERLRQVPAARHLITDTPLIGRPVTILAAPRQPGALRGHTVWLLAGAAGPGGTPPAAAAPARLYALVDGETGTVWNTCLDSVLASDGIADINGDRASARSGASTRWSGQATWAAATAMIALAALATRRSWRVLARRRAAPPPRAPEPYLLNNRGAVALVGTPEHQAAIRAALARWHTAAPRHPREPARMLALLYADPEHSREPLAIAVHVAGCGTIGHLSPADARAYRTVLGTLAARGQVGACQATIIGAAPSWRVWLALASPERALA